MKKQEEGKIIRNSAKCRLCKDKIESKYRHDFVSCGCKEISVDGGTYYMRRFANNFENFIDTSITTSGNMATITLSNKKKKATEIKKPRILFWDIETSLSVLGSFSLHPEFLTPSNIIYDWHIICGAWKFLGEDKIYTASINDYTEKNINDYEVVKKLRDALLEADIIVHHNGDKFDLRKLNARLAYHKLDPLPNKLTTIDTYKEARKTFAFTSNKLDYLGKYLNLGNKLEIGIKTWRNALFGNDEAIDKISNYNKQDVIILEALYKRIRPYIKHPNIAAFAHNDSFCCVDCQSTNLKPRGYTGTKQGIQRRYACESCGKWGQASTLDFKTQLKAA